MDDVIDKQLDCPIGGVGELGFKFNNASDFDPLWANRKFRFEFGRWFEADQLKRVRISRFD